VAGAPPGAAERYLYAGDRTGKVVVFDLQRPASTPAWTLRGGGTLGVPYGLAVDARAALFVADADAGDLFLFGAGATGDAEPALALRGPGPGIDVPSGLALGADGSVFVANLGSGTVSVFPPALGADGVPLARIDATLGGIHGPGAVAVDPAGRLAVAGFADDAVAFFRRDDAGAWQPAGRLAGPATRLDSPAGLAFDRAGNLYVADANADSATVYAADATGNAVPVRELRGSLTRLHNPTGLALGADGTAYVASFSTAEIEAFAPNAGGNVAPVRTFSGGIRGPLGLALAPAVAAATTAVDLSSAPVLAALAEFPSAVLTPGGTLTAVDGAVTRSRVDLGARAETARATIAKASATLYAGILLGSSLRDGYFLDFDGTGACLLRKFVAGREVRSWPAATPALPNGTGPRNYRLRARRTPAGLELSGDVDGDAVGPIVDPVVPARLNAFAVFTGGPEGTLRAFRIDAEPLPHP